MISPDKRRQAVEQVQAVMDVSERRVCRVLGQPRATQRYKKRVAEDEEILATRMVALASEYGRYGYRRITQSSGQGHQTAYAQIVAEQFGVPAEHVHVLQGDTDKIATGLGTGGSASIPSGGVSVQRATHELGNKLKELAAQALEAGAGDLEIADGRVRIAGTDRSVGFADLAKRPGGDTSKMNASATFASADGTYPNGTHLAEVEIDPATGIIKIVSSGMVEALRLVTVSRGEDPREYVLVAFGGAGPVHAALLAQELKRKSPARQGATA